MGLNKELWISEIQDQLYANFELLKTISTDHTPYMIKNGLYRKIYIPNAGSSGSVVIDGNSYPAAVSNRVDTSVEYSLNKFETLPTLVSREDLESVAYDKINSVTKQMVGDLGEATMYTTFSNWYIGKVTGKYVETTGSGVTASAPGATGTRKSLTAQDVINAKKILDKQSVPPTGRVLLLSSEMSAQLLSDIALVSKNITLVDNDGLMMYNQLLYGFKVIEMPYVIYADSGATSRGYMGVTGTTDLEISLAYHPNFVGVAKDEPYLFGGEKEDATYYGYILSSQAFCGGKYTRTDLKGVVPIIQKIV